MNVLPSLNALKTFTVVAETLNFTRAAHKLHVTQGAISRQIAGLERELGYALFVRQSRGLTLTPRGASLLLPVKQALGTIGEALTRVASQPETLRIKCPTCAMRWMLPRVIQLQNDEPEIRIELTASVSHGVDFGSEHFDAAVIFSDQMEKQRRVYPLFDEILTPVCTPDFLQSKEGVLTPDDLADQTLLHPTRDRRDWLLWLRAAGYNALPSSKAQHFDTLDLAINAALQGFGVAIGDLTLIEDDLRARRVIAPFPLSVATGAAYYLVVRESLSESDKPQPALSRAIEYFMAEAQRSRLTSGRLIEMP